MQFAVLDIVGRGFIDDIVACLQADIDAADTAAGVGDILRSSKFTVFIGCDRAAVANISATDTAVAGSCYRAGIGKRIACYQNALINPPTIDNIVIIIIHFIDLLILVIIFIFPFGNLFSLVI